MAVAAYSTNLSDFEDFEGSAPSFSTELLGYTATAKGSVTDTDFPIQGSTHASAEQRTAATGSMAIDYGSNISWTSGWNFFMWGMFLAPAAVNSFANAGIEMAVGSSISAFHRWTVGGNDFGRYPYGGWQNFVVNPEVSAGRTTTGSPGTNYRWVGLLCDVISAIAKGSPYGVDAIRYGRGDIEVINGESGNYGTFDGMATANDASTAKWGLFQYDGGSYLWKGLMSLGTTGTAVDFRDANRNIVVDNTINVLSGFNAIEVNNTSSNIEWTNINISALGTVSPGTFEMVDDADVALDTCVFTDMSTFVFDSNGVIDDCTFRRCGQVTQGSADIDGCLFDESSATASILSDNVTLITNCQFISDGSNHAIQLTSTGTYSLTGHTFTGYATTTGSTGNEVIYNNSGGSVTLNASGNVGTISYRNGSGASTTVVADPVTLTVNDIITGSDIVIYEAGTETVLDDAQENSGTSWGYVYDAEDAGDYIDIGVFLAGYKPKYVRNYQLSASSTSVPAKQEVDRDYLE